MKLGIRLQVDGLAFSRRESQPPVAQGVRRYRAAYVVAAAVALMVSGCVGERAEDTAALLPEACATGTMFAAFWGSDQQGGPFGLESGSPRGGDIWSLSREGAVTQLTEGANTRDPSISDDGQRLYFTKSAGGLRADVPAPGKELWVRDFRTGQNTLLFDTGSDDLRVGDPEESPDGRRVGFSAQVGGEADARPKVYVVDLANPTDVTELPMPPIGDGWVSQFASEPTWGQDSSTVAYLRTQNADHTGWQDSVRVIDLRMMEDSLVYEADLQRDTLSSLQWSNDGRRFVAIEGGKFLIVIDAVTGAKSTVAQPQRNSVELAADDGSMIGSVGSTPDQVDNPGNPQNPSLASITGEGTVTYEAMDPRITFAADLTMADCAFSTD